MKHTTAALAALFLLSATVPALARTTTSTGPHGTTTAQSSGSCANGACSHQRQVTYPGGATRSSSGSTACANGTCNHQAQGTGVRGGTWQRSSTSTRTRPPA